MFERLETAPSDPILGLTEAFNHDPRPDKINLGVGVYKDENGKTPIMASVKKAEAELLKRETTKNYLGMAGLPELGVCVQKLVFGSDHPIIAAKRACSAQTPGGTGGLRVAGDFIKTRLPSTKIWVSQPTWPNHNGIFKAAGLEVGTYPYYDAAGKGLDFSGMIKALEQVAAGEAVLFHASCHNPSGVDPTAEQWEQLAELAARKKWLPLVDFAYQGLGDGLEEDAVGVRALAARVPEMLIVSSFSKNFGLYNERIGALTVVAADPAAANKAFGHIKIVIRTIYSNPPAHGAGIVTTVLQDTALNKLWVDEVAAMRNRINGMRHLFVDTLKTKGVRQDFDFITNQRGMFSFSGLNDEQVQTLRDKYGIYIVGGGRINVAGMTTSNMDRLCTAIAEVLAG
ncbi:MAG: aspartate/tyrosine/aromatic aminotransferase [Phycisphaerales bacterium]|nr:aspartate/tyrosine/aromatic aminotransferase [Phycisphaerales bacterium]